MREEDAPFPLGGGRAGDGGERRRPPPIGAPVRNARRLRKAMTLAEKLLWAELRRLALHVRRQVPVGRYVADFAVLRSRFVIKIDGPWHALDGRDLHDAERDAWFAAQGYCTLRFTNAQVVDDINAVLRVIQAAAPPPPSPALPPSRGKGA